VPEGAKSGFPGVKLGCGEIHPVKRDREHSRPLRFAKADLDRLAGVGALVEKVAALLRIVVGNTFPDDLPRRLDGLEGL
jgi:hypothetical protein